LILKSKSQSHSGLAFHLSLYQISRHFIPSSSFECSSCPLLLHTPPLLEEKWNFDSQALIPNIRDPFLHDGSRTWTGLAADDHPIDFEFCNALA
jgi:hypothetical protein